MCGLYRHTRLPRTRAATKKALCHERPSGPPARRQRVVRRDCAATSHVPMNIGSVERRMPSSLPGARTRARRAAAARVGVKPASQCLTSSTQHAGDRRHRAKGDLLTHPWRLVLVGLAEALLRCRSSGEAAGLVGDGEEGAEPDRLPVQTPCWSAVPPLLLCAAALPALRLLCSDLHPAALLCCSATLLLTCSGPLLPSSELLALSLVLLGSGGGGGGGAAAASLCSGLCSAALLPPLCSSAAGLSTRSAAPSLHVLLCCCSVFSLLVHA